MKTSTLLCCSLLALVAVTQVSSFETRTEAATERIGREVARVRGAFTIRLEGIRPAFERLATRATAARAQADAQATALVARIRAKGGNFSLCALAQDADRTAKVDAANEATAGCTEAVTASVLELGTSSHDVVSAVHAKGTFEECRPPVDGNSNENSESRRCVDRRLSEWLRLLREIERNWARIQANRANTLVQRGQRCLATSAKEADDALRELTREATRCDRETARTARTARTSTTTLNTTPEIRPTETTQATTGPPPSDEPIN